MCRERLAAVGEPTIAVVIPAFNKWEVTRRCLESLVRCDPDIALQVIVVDDASSDETAASAATLPGIDLVRSGVSAGFVGSCNRGALLARAPYLLFLNNDTEVTANSLRALVQRMESDLRIGIVGSKLVYPDGRLQEAGGIIWSDASGWNYGRSDSPLRPEYNFARDVDYVSGASLMVRSELFASLGGFDRRFAPGYYEDADLCFAVRALGYRVVYEPRSVVTHYEGLSSGTDLGAGMKQFQVVNQIAFRAKWSDVLDASHAAPDPDNVRCAARARCAVRGAILVVDSYVPMYDREAGSKRLRHLIDGFVAAGRRVVFLPDNIAALEPYTGELQDAGVEVLYYSEGDPRRWRELLLDALSTVDAAWICRPELCRKYLPAIRAHSDIPILYDTIDLHHLRLRRQVELEGTGDAEWRRLEELELMCARAADGTVVVTESEAQVLRSAGIAPVAVVPTIHNVEPCAPRTFADTDGLIFIGGYNHTPNVDAARWLVREIMPVVWKRLPEVVVTLLGANPPETVLELAGARVGVPGYVRDVEPYFLGARMFVAPLRYGAGMNGKVGHALAYGLPTVTTSVGAAGFGLTDGSDSLVADDVESFAAAVVALYEDQALWSRISARSADPLAAFGSERVVGTALETIDRLVARRRNFASSPV
jgi:GT2 family glycosyltransferase/glycosyltransferase involved in cell wall biosynthesis